MSRLINDTIEAYNLYLEGELSIEELEYGIEAGLISESLLIELDATMLSEDVNELKAKLHDQRQGALNNLDRHVANVDDHVRKIDKKDIGIKEKLHSLITQDAMKHIDEKHKELQAIKKDTEKMKDESEYKGIAARIKSVNKEIKHKERQYKNHMFTHGTRLGMAISNPVVRGAAIAGLAIKGVQSAHEHGLI